MLLFGKGKCKRCENNHLLAILQSAGKLLEGFDMGEVPPNLGSSSLLVEGNLCQFFIPVFISRSLILYVTWPLWCAWESKSIFQAGKLYRRWPQSCFKFWSNTFLVCAGGFSVLFCLMRFEIFIFIFCNKSLRHLVGFWSIFPSFLCQQQNPKLFLKVPDKLSLLSHPLASFDSYPTGKNSTDNPPRCEKI